MPETALHPAVAPVIEALNTLADYQPESAADLADVLRAIHNLTTEQTVFGALGAALECLAEWSHRSEGTEPGFAGERVAELLYDAASHLSGVGSDFIDRARADTGHFSGSAVAR